MGDKMKTLYLLRHAKSSWDDSRVSDFDRPLNNRGRREAEKIAEYMKENKYIPEYIICSTAKRTRETLDLILNIIKLNSCISSVISGNNSPIIITVHKPVVIFKV